jgi:hypothetical protein
MEAKPVTTSDTLSEWVVVEDAAQRLGISVRTVYRRIKAGELVTQCQTDGRTLVRMPADSDTVTERHNAEVVDLLRQQAGRAEALALTVVQASDRIDAERASTLAEAKAATVAAKRAAWSGWAVAACLLASVAAVAVWGLAVADRLSDTVTRAETAEAATDGVRAELGDMTQRHTLSQEQHAATVADLAARHAEAATEAGEQRQRADQANATADAERQRADAMAIILATLTATDDCPEEADLVADGR